MNKELTPLEALEKLTNYKCSCLSEKIKCKEIIETALKENENRKELMAEMGKQSLRIAEALDIIKNTRVDTNLIKLSNSYDNYCGLEAAELLNGKYTAKQKGITEEEYDLLKEVLEHETNTNKH